MTCRGTAPGWIQQALRLTAAAALLGTLAQWVSPTRIPWREDWSRYVESKALAAGLTLTHLDDVQRMVREQSHLLLDARPVADYDRGHLPGAFSLPQTELDTYYPQILPLLSASQPLVVYCSGKECDESFLLSLYLREQGFTNISLYVGGYLEWQASTTATEGAP